MAWFLKTPPHTPYIYKKLHMLYIIEAIECGPSDQLQHEYVDYFPDHKNLSSAVTVSSKNVPLTHKII